MKNYTQINPTAIKLGDHMIQHGAVYVVEKMLVVTYSAAMLAELPAYFKTEPSIEVRDDSGSMYNGPHNDVPTFVVSGSFVEGDKEMFDYFRGRYSQGEKCGQRHEYTSQQGNARAYWLRQAA